MNLYTSAEIPKAPFYFSFREQMLLLGSCFAEHIGTIMKGNKFDIDLNPFGILYNPASVARAIRRLLHPEPFSANDLFLHDGLYHSFEHHSRFSSSNREECLQTINRQLAFSAGRLQNIRRIIVTWGTSWVYRLKSNGDIVANCHKIPEKEFERARLSVDEIVVEWRSVLNELWKIDPEIKLLFTISPVRHLKDGAHGNQLSKSVLLLAVDILQKENLGKVAYFPAYEIMMDELRDYRFYADDMLHPSSLAVEYIWQRFSEHMLSEETRQTIKEWQLLQKAINHKPFHPESKSYKTFISQTLLKMEQLSEKFPFFDNRIEIETLKKRI